MGDYNHNNCIKPVISIHTLYDKDEFKAGIDFPVNGDIVYKDMKFNGFRIKATEYYKGDEKIVLGGDNITAKYEVDDSAIIVDRFLSHIKENNKDEYFVSSYMKDTLIDTIMKKSPKNKIKNFRESFKYIFTKDDILELPIENVFINTTESTNYIPKLLTDSKINKEIYNHLIYDEELYYKLFTRNIGSLSMENRGKISDNSLDILDRKMPLYLNDVRLTFLDYFGNDTIFMEKWNSLNEIERNNMFDFKRRISNSEIIIPVLHGLYLIYKISFKKYQIINLLNDRISKENKSSSNFVELNKPILIFATVFRYIDKKEENMDIPIVFVLERLPYNEIIEFLNSNNDTYDMYPYFKIMDNIHDYIGYSY